jgi:uncharacterized protein
MTMKKTLIVGASSRSTSYAYLALNDLETHGHEVILFNPNGRDVEGREVYTSLTEINEAVDTVTVYVRASRLEGLLDELIRLKPQRVIFNPGTEGEGLQKCFESAGIEALEACTLVLLRTGQY